MKKSIPIIAALLLCRCGNDVPYLSGTERVPGKDAASLAAFPAEPVLSPALQVRVADARSLADLLSAFALVKLEAGGDSVIGEVTDLVFHHQHWFVVDQYSCRVFKFRRDGSFVAAFGGRGEGPGEFQYPKKIRVIYDGLLGISDPIRGTVQVFDTDGTFVRSTQPRVGGSVYPARFNFLWNRPDTLVLPSYPGRKPNVPQHVVLDASSRSHRLRFGFGDRIPAVEKAAGLGAPKKAFTAFERIDNRYWSGSPYRTYVDVYDDNFRHLARLGEDVARNFVDMIDPRDVEDLPLANDPRQALREKILSKSANLSIARIGDLVLVQLGYFYDVYDYQGNLLGANLKSGDIRMLYTFDDFLVMPIEAELPGPAENDSRVGAMLAGAGLGPEDNPALLLYKLDLVGGDGEHHSGASVLGKADDRDPNGSSFARTGAHPK